MVLCMQWAESGGKHGKIGGVLEGLLIENSGDKHGSPVGRGARAWRLLVPGQPPVASVRIDAALSSKNGFNLHVGNR